MELQTDVVVSRSYGTTRHLGRAALMDLAQIHSRGRFMSVCETADSTRRLNLGLSILTPNYADQTEPTIVSKIRQLTELKADFLLKGRVRVIKYVHARSRKLLDLTVRP